MNSDRTLSLFVALMMLLSALPLLVPDASGTRWEQTSTADFDDGESFFVDTSGGTLKLSRGLTAVWSDQGEAASDYFGMSVASAGDVNGDLGIDIFDVIATVNFILGNTNSIDCADMNGDENVNLLDIIALVNIIIEI